MCPLPGMGPIFFPYRQFGLDVTKTQPDVWRSLPLSFALFTNEGTEDIDEQGEDGGEKIGFPSFIR